MSTNLSAKGQKVYEFFRKNPNASASAAAAKHKMSISNVYKMRARALEDLRNSVVPEDDGTPGPSLAHEALLGADFAMRKAQQTPEQKAKRAAHYFPGHVPDVNETLDARAENYGKFKDGAALMQAIKRELAAHAAKHGKTFADDQWEALEMIVHKIGRIVNGNPDVIDHWVDIAGYATLVADRLDGRVR
jgi:hypothetical protein